MGTHRQTFRLYPNSTQEKALFEARRLHVYLYNACVSERKTNYKLGLPNPAYMSQQNALPSFKAEWPEFARLYSQSLQATVKRVDFAFQRFIKGLSKSYKFKSIKKASGWTYPSYKGWSALTDGKHGKLKLNDLGITVRMRGQAKEWGKPTTLTIVYKPHENKWYASITVEVTDVEPLYGSDSELSYESMVSYDLGTETAITLYNGSEFEEISNPRFSREGNKKVRQAAKAKRRKRNPIKGKQKASRRWKKANRKESKLKSKIARQRKDWQHKVTSEIASRYDIGVTEKLETKKMTRKPKKGSKRKRQKSGLNREILSVGFGTINKQISYKIHGKGGIVLELPTKKVKPSQRCPQCGEVHKEWAKLSERFHSCGCGFGMPRDRASTVVMYQVADNTQPGLGLFSLASLRVFSSTDSIGKRKHTGSMKQLGAMKRQKSQRQNVDETGSETPIPYALG